jgi:hypothetical protein
MTAEIRSIGNPSINLREGFKYRFRLSSTSFAATVAFLAGGVMADRGWKRQFDEPIPLPRGRQLVTLKDAADYIMKLPKAEQKLAEWQTAVRCLIGAAEGRDFIMHARIGVTRALNRHVGRVFESSRKDYRRGNRKLKRDRS